LKNKNQLYSFFFKIILIWLSWKIFIFIIGQQSDPINERFFPKVSLVWENFNQWYKDLLLGWCELLLDGLGYDSYILGADLLKIKGYSGVRVGHYCLGFQLMYYFSMLIIVSEISKSGKFIGLISGIVITTLLNIIRISGLNLMTLYAPNWLFLSHDYIFNFSVFGVLMLLYYKLLK
jgi:exosortase/archaeosortase family protein